MHKFVTYGLTALAAGLIVGGAYLDLSHSWRPASQADTSRSEITRNAFLANPDATERSGNPFIASAMPMPTATPVPPTATPVPPTPTPTRAAPIKTGAATAPQVNAWSVAVIDEASGALIYGRDPHRRLAPASTTKIFTALVALAKGGDLRREINVQFDQSELYDSTLMGIHPGEIYTLEDLLYGLMLPSGNDAALAIANDLGGNEAGFATMMNAQAEALGLTDSHFVNPHGLDRPNHYSSAYDLAMAARYGMLTYPEFRDLARALAWNIHGSRSWTVYNLNRLLRDYPGADGVKIGFTDNSGPAIVASATRDGHRVYVALLHCGDIVGDSTPLFNWVFSNFTWSNTGPTPASTVQPST